MRSSSLSVTPPNRCPFYEPFLSLAWGANSPPSHERLRLPPASSTLAVPKYRAECRNDRWWLIVFALWFHPTPYGMCVCVCVCVRVLVTQSCLAPYDPWTIARQAPLSMEFSRQEILEWVPISFSRWSSWPRFWTWVFCTVGKFFTIWATWEALWDVCKTLNIKRENTL